MKAVVFGVFDGLHQGHRYFLRRARGRANRLIVILARDEAVIALKNRRPLHSEKERRQKLLASGLVDEVRLGDKEQGVYHVLRKLKPNIIAVGYDQQDLRQDLVRARSWLGFKFKLIEIDPFYPNIFKSRRMHSDKQKNKPDNVVREERIVEFWEKNNIFRRTLEKTKGRKRFVFYEGPPTANAPPGIHHVLARSFKDLIPRYKTMRGCYVERKAGWDTHGLPVEIAVEKKLGIRSKRDIEKYGVERFNEECRREVWAHKLEWERLTRRMGYWLDLTDPYITYEPAYMESLWWIIKQIWKKGLLQESRKILAWCPRCETGLSSHEVAQGYKQVVDPAVWIKFKASPGQRVASKKLPPSTCLLSWTTTPWTLPGNVALAVHPKKDYCLYKLGGREYLIAAKDSPVGRDGKSTEVLRFKGGQLVGLKYQQLYPIRELAGEHSHRVYAAEFVDVEEGTGIVHTAVMYGEDDYELGEKHGLPRQHTVAENGTFNTLVTTLRPAWKNKNVRDLNQKIIADLADQSLIWKTAPHRHSYPFCWRCQTALIYYAKKAWFIKITKLKQKLIENSEEINWVPASLKKGRFGNFLKELRDWTFSRERYWGTPLPIWRCDGCKKVAAVGSREELTELTQPLFTLTLVRHGEAENNVKGIVSSWPEKKTFALTDKGRQQVQKLALRLKGRRIDVIYASPLLRTRQTAQIIAKTLGVPLVTDERLREVGYGVLNPSAVSKTAAILGRRMTRFLNPDLKIKSGESLQQVRRRVGKFLQELSSKHKGEHVVVVSHGDPLLLMWAVAQGLSTKELALHMEDYPETASLKTLKYHPLPVNKQGEVDLHRPHVDKIPILCKTCKKKMRREPYVIDVWFDSGAMPFAQHHWPFSAGKIPYPADYISEGVDQTRGWFYTLLATSTLLDKGPSYRNVISLGHILDEKGKKMSKSKGNIVDPWEMIDRYGVDAVRWYFYAVNSPGLPILFSEKDLASRARLFLHTIQHSLSFLKLYGSGFRAAGRADRPSNALDRWMLARLNETISLVGEKLDKFDVFGSARALEILVDDLSNWYIRRSRRRLQKPASPKEFAEAFETLTQALLELSKVVAPFVPFLAEHVHQEIRVLRPDLGLKRSVHLETWPRVNKKLIDNALIEDMSMIREVASLALKLRRDRQLKVRQPLSELFALGVKLAEDHRDELLALLKDELNVKKVTLLKKAADWPGTPSLVKARIGKISVALETKLTPELLEEGTLRELLRILQMLRKRAGLRPQDKISVIWSGQTALKRLVVKYDREIRLEAGAVAIKPWGSVDGTVLAEAELSRPRGRVGICDIIK